MYLPRRPKVAPRPLTTSTATIFAAATSIRNFRHISALFPA
ncbi:hypothetical protein PMIN01_04997 [Paraphaeosphaeria minitans]|uniref:Uncharacterized protein n=1 Tax=Paraphaeosphaeria minitans TaxID=565426 RepID=A0A9P6GLD1_9PLEO|nr:hypothetical protein PMIN01_04997 [Paraphaeosphaeria minitans]